MTIRAPAGTVRRTIPILLGGHKLRRAKGMSRTSALSVPLLLVSLTACDSSVTDSGSALLDLDVQYATGVNSSAIDAGVVHVQGPTDREVNIVPGTTTTIDGLLPGTYAVALEGLTGGEVETFGETTGIAVTAGRNTAVSILLSSFVPVLNTTPSLMLAGQAISIEFSAVVGAVGYRVEWDTDAGFPNPQSSESATTNASITIGTKGTYHFRVRARNRFNTLGRPSMPTTIAVSPVQHALTVSGAGQGAGTVTSSPAGITCSINAGSTSSDCAESYDSGTVVTLTAAAASGSVFVGWNGASCAGTGPCTVTMAAARTVVADFGRTSQDLTLTLAGTGTGQVAFSVDPSGGTCAKPATASCIATFGSPVQVTLTATANPGSTFSGWSGGTCSGVNPCPLTMNAARSATATFTGAPNTLALTIVGNGSGTVALSATPVSGTCSNSSKSSCTASYDNAQQQVTLTATADPGSTFEGWTGGQCSGTGPCTITMNAPRNVTATFIRQVFTITLDAGNSNADAQIVGSGINCDIHNGMLLPGSSQQYPPACSISLPAGTSVQINGYLFVGTGYWESGLPGDPGCPYNPHYAFWTACSFTLTGNVTLHPRAYSQALTAISNARATVGFVNSCLAGSTTGTPVTITFDYYDPNFDVYGPVRLLLSYQPTGRNVFYWPTFTMAGDRRQGSISFTECIQFGTDTQATFDFDIEDPYWSPGGSNGLQVVVPKPSGAN